MPNSVSACTIAVMTSNDVHDSAVLKGLLAVAEAELEQVSANGAYDQLGCYDTIAAHSAKAVIPPRKNAKDSAAWQP